MDYLAPQDKLLDEIRIGSRARVLFGNRKLTGIVIGKSDSSSFPQSKLKKVNEILDIQPVFDKLLLELLLWTASYYQQPIGEVLNAALPKQLRQGKFITPYSKSVFKLSGSSIDKSSFSRAPKQLLLYELLKSHPNGLDANAISNKVSNWRPTINTLIKKNLVLKTQCSDAEGKKQTI